jgi:hypothetical protein
MIALVSSVVQVEDDVVELLVVFLEVDEGGRPRRWMSGE